VVKTPWMASVLLNVICSLFAYFVELSGLCTCMRREDRVERDRHTLPCVDL
jgi:hypothetical protein